MTTADRIVDSARRCFERYGITKTTIEDIARAAGVSRPTVYKHFGGKERIVDHIGLIELEKVQHGLRARMKHYPDFAARLTEILLVSIRVSAENLYIRRLIEDIQTTAHSQEPFGPFQVQARARWHALLERGRQSGELAGDLDTDDVVAWLSMSQVMLLGLDHQTGGDEARLRHVIRRFVVEPLLAARGA